MCNSAAHNSRKNRESLTKRLGLRAWAVRARDGEACVYCGATRETSGHALHLDHVDPSTKGTPAGDCPENLVVACHGCNSARQQMTLAAWAKRVAETRGESPAAVRARVARALRTKLDLAAAKALRDSRKAALPMHDDTTCPICGLDAAARQQLEAHARTLGLSLADLIAVAAEALVEAAEEKSTDSTSN